MMRRTIGCSLAMALALAGCGKRHDSSESAGNQTAAVPPSPAAESPQAASPGTFSIDKLPVSQVPLGAFPYLGLPDGYEWGDNGKGETHDFDHFPFWTGTAIQDVEGKLFMTGIFPRDGKTWSEYEVKKNIGTLVTQAGGVKITESRIPASITDGWGDDIRAGKTGGLGDVYNRPAETFVIRRPDRAIWIHLVTDNASGNMAVAETRPFVATAKLLSADALKQAIDAQGKAVVHVNFATDATTILPDSQPQIDAIAALLKQAPTLRLAINGYTDETGSAAHNRTLSDGRAASVRQSLVAAGIDAARLTAKGFGSDDAVAGNDTAAGKARNRRVELVKL